MVDKNSPERAKERIALGARGQEQATGIFDIFALAGLEVTIPYSEAVKLAPANSPLQRFAR